MAQRLKHLPAMQETWVQSLGWEDPLEKETATHSSILAWRIPWTFVCILSLLYIFCDYLYKIKGLLFRIFVLSSIIFLYFLFYPSSFMEVNILFLLCTLLFSVVKEVIRNIQGIIHINKITS